MKVLSKAKHAREGSAPIELAFLIPFVILLGVILFYTCHLGIRRLKDESTIRQVSWEKRGKVSSQTPHPYQVQIGLLDGIAEKSERLSMGGITQAHYSGLTRLHFLPQLAYQNQAGVVAGTWDAARMRKINKGWEDEIGGGILAVNIHTNIVRLFLDLKGFPKLMNDLKDDMNGALKVFRHIPKPKQSKNDLDTKKGQAEKQLRMFENNKRLMEQELQALIPGSPEWIQKKKEIDIVDQKIHQLEKAFDQGNW